MLYSKTNHKKLTTIRQRNSFAQRKIVSNSTGKKKQSYNFKRLKISWDAGWNLDSEMRDKLLKQKRDKHFRHFEPI